MEVDSASSVKKLTAMFDSIESNKDIMAMKQVKKFIFDRRLPEKPEKSSPQVVDGQANNGEAKAACDTVHMDEMAKDKTNMFEKPASPKYVQLRKAGLTKAMEKDGKDLEDLIAQVEEEMNLNPVDVMQAGNVESMN